jgi:hypothetical protein
MPLLLLEEYLICFSMEDMIMIKGRTIYFEDHDLYKELKHLAIDKDMSVSKFIESILSDYVKNSKSDS